MYLLSTQCSNGGGSFSPPRAGLTASSVHDVLMEFPRWEGAKREVTFAGLKRNAVKILGAINQDHGKNFSRIIIRKVANGDFTAGHKAKMGLEVAA